MDAHHIAGTFAVVYELKNRQVKQVYKYTIKQDPEIFSQGLVFYMFTCLRVYLLQLLPHTFQPVYFFESASIS